MLLEGVKALLTWLDSPLAGSLGDDTGLSGSERGPNLPLRPGRAWIWASVVARTRLAPLRWMRNPGNDCACLIPENRRINLLRGLKG